MSFQTPITIAQAIRNIEANAYLLPAIQREFVWGHEQIERLFDSIMQSYPFSSFLFWRVQPETATNFQFYRFLRDYQERWNTHNELHDTRGLPEFTAILDGQQRLTSLYIGLRGSYAYKTPRLWDDRFSDKVYPKRRLYLNIRQHVAESDDARKFDFRFLSREEFDRAPADWFEVGKIMSLTSLSELNRFLKETGWRDDEFASDTLSRLQEAIHTTACINYFQETDQALDKALNIFIRINSGGEPLNFSDLVMSIAVAKWQGARQEIHQLVDDVGNLGFKISKDFVLKVALLRHSDDIKFKVDNFGNATAEAFRDHWPSTRQAILEGFRLVASFGHTDKTLVSKNAVLPIIYFLIESNLTNEFVAGMSYKEDRLRIRRWLNSVLLNRNFGTHSDQILKRLRDKMKGSSGSGFPLTQILEAAKEIGKGNRTDDEFLEELLFTQKDDAYAHAILSLLYPDLDVAHGLFHQDHLHPASGFHRKTLQARGFSKEDLDFYLDDKNWNSILNLQLLEGRENEAKNAAPLREWVEQQVAGMASESVDTFCRKRNIPVEGLDLLSFRTFIEKRRELILEALRREMV